MTPLSWVLGLVAAGGLVFMWADFAVRVVSGHRAPEGHYTERATL